jgi:hypothetical protein
LLLGDATYKFKDFLETGVTNQMPPLMVKTSYLRTASDPALGAINGDDALPDVAIGRLPAKNPEELRVMVSKILAYETGEASLESLLVLVSETGARGDRHGGPSTRVAKATTPMRVWKAGSLHAATSSQSPDSLPARATRGKPRDRRDLFRLRNT